MSSLRKISIIVLVGLLPLLTSCSPEENTLHLVKNPKLLQEILYRCNKMTTMRERSDPECIQAITVDKQVRLLLSQLLADPEGYGQSIIAHQVTLMHKEKQLKYTKTREKRADLLRKIRLIQQQIAIMQAVSGLAGE